MYTGSPAKHPAGGFFSSASLDSKQWRKDVLLLVINRIKQIEELKRNEEAKASLLRDQYAKLKQKFLDDFNPIFLMYIFLNEDIFSYKQKYENSNLKSENTKTSEEKKSYCSEEKIIKTADYCARQIRRKTRKKILAFLLNTVRKSLIGLYKELQQQWKIKIP